MKNFSSEVEAVDHMVSEYKKLNSEVGKVIIGQQEVVKEVLISVFSGGHALLVGVPGLAKTLLVNTIADSLGLSFKRIQFTPDLMPSDIIGSEILDENRHFRFIKGPLFANIILADEINRTPPKTQSALLEAMQERAVTAAGTRYPLDAPFFVLATQNPIEQEGTYPLPEAQLDRFMMNIWVDYPSFNEEIEIVRATTGDVQAKAAPVMSAQDILFYQQLVRKIPVTENVLQYAVSLVAKTRPGDPSSPDMVKKYVSWGAGPRASQYLVIGAKCHAAITGKYAPDIEDVRAVAISVLRHRVVRNYIAEAEGYTIEKIIKSLF